MRYVKSTAAAATAAAAAVWYTIACAAVLCGPSLTLTPSAPSILVGATVQLTASGGTGNTRWSSATPAVATVTDSGLVTGLTVGTATLTARRSTLDGTTLVTVTVPPSAPTYYVRTDGNNANTGLANSAGGAWRTVDWAADHVTAGQTVRVQSGTYAETITQGVHGTFGSPITFVADGVVSTEGWVITGDYVRIIGFVVEGANTRSSGIYLQNADFVELWHNTVQNFTGDAIRTDSGGRVYQSTNGVFIGNVLKNSGLKDFQVRGAHNLVAYNEADRPVVDFLYLFGQYNQVLNNYSHDINAAADSHTDFIQSEGDTALGLGHSLYEANVYADASGSDHHCTNIQLNNASLDGEQVFRRNVWSTSGDAGGQCYGLNSANTFLKLYHETIAYAVHYVSIFDQGGSATGRGSQNNLWYNGWWAGITTPEIYSNTPASHDYNLLYNSTGSVTFPANITSEAHTQRNVNPTLVNAGSRDFRLLVGSPAIAAGGPLTTTVGSGTGTTVTVADATYFRGDDPTIAQYNGQLIMGDTITVGTDVVTIASISGNAITVTASFTWANGESVYYGSDPTPDIGAYPYKSSGYTLSATDSVAGTTATVTPNDASLVRFVICFENGIPTTVDNASPYTCTVTAGTTRVFRVYPLYPSATLWAVATP